MSRRKPHTADPSTAPGHQLRFVAPDPRKHSRELFDLLAKTFSHRGYFGFRDYCRDRYIGHSHYDWHTSRIALLDGRIVAHCGVWDYRMRIGRCAIRTAGVGAVATHGDYRGRGLMTRLMPAAIDAMRQNGYLLSVLFGIRNFYHRFRYVSAWPSTSHVVRLCDLPSQAPSPRPRAFTPRRRKDLDALYNRQHAGLTGTAVRPTYRKCRRANWRGYLWADARKPGRSSRPAPKRARGGCGRDRPVRGYVLVVRDGRTLRCLEACGAADQALRVLAWLARKWGCGEVRFEELAYRHPLARHLRRGTCRVETAYCNSGGPMVRTVNLPGVLGAVRGELLGRLQSGGLAGWRGTLLISDGEGEAALSIARPGARVLPTGPGRHAVRGGAGIARLLIGGGEPREIVPAAGIRLAGDAAKLVDVLFGNQHPMLSPWDSF